MTMWTLATLREHRETIVALAAQHGASDVRVVGSVAKGTANASSDVDFLVTFRDDASIFDQVGLWLDLQDLLGCPVDLLTDHPQAGRVTQSARHEAQPL